MKAVGICLPLVCSPDISSLLPLFFFSRHTFSEFPTEETWPQMVLGVGEEAAKGRPRAPESSSVMGPGLGYLGRSSMSRSAVGAGEGRGPGAGSGRLLLCPQGWLPGWDPGQSPGSDGGPHPHSEQMWEGAWLGKEDTLIKSHEFIHKTQPRNTLLPGLLRPPRPQAALSHLLGLPSLSSLGFTV